MLQDFAGVINNYSVLRANNAVEKKLLALTDQLDKYKNIFGKNADRNDIFQEVGQTKSQLEQVRMAFSEKSHSLDELQTLLKKTEETLHESKDNHQRLQGDKSTLINDLDQERATCEQQRESIAQLEQQKTELEEELVQLKHSSTKNYDALSQAKNTLETELKQKIKNLESILSGLTDKVSAFAEEYGDDFLRSVKSWGIRKHAAELMRQIHETLLKK
jgi:chromosome segregation ATPase